MGLLHFQLPQQQNRLIHRRHLIGRLRVSLKSPSCSNSHYRSFRSPLLEAESSRKLARQEVKFVSFFDSLHGLFIVEKAQKCENFELYCTFVIYARNRIKTVQKEV